MTTPTPASNSFVSREPVVVAAAVAWLFSFVGSLILGHTSLITSTQWSSLSTILVPVVSALILGAVTWVTRKYVAPAWKLLTGVTHTAGIPDKFLIELAANGVTTELKALAAKNPELAKLLAAVEAAQKNKPAGS